MTRETCRTSVAAYVATDRHLRADLRGAKTLTQIAAELGTTKTTVRGWLRRDHWELWLEHWPTVEDLWEARQQERLATHSGRPRPNFQMTLEPFCMNETDEDGSLGRGFSPIPPQSPSW